LPVQLISTSVKRSPVGTSDNMFRTLLSAHSPRSSNFPLNLPVRTVPIPANAPLSIRMRDPINDKSSRFGSCAIISRICVRVTTPELMTKEVTDCGNFQSEGTRNGGAPPYPNRCTLSVFVKHEVYSKNRSGTQSCPAIQTRNSLTRWAGLSSGTGNTLNHLCIFLAVKRAEWKRCRRHEVTHDLDTRAHARRVLRMQSAAR